LLIVISIFVINIAALCQEDDGNQTREAAAAYVEPGTACLIYSLDDEKTNSGSGSRWLTCDSNTMEVGLTNDSGHGMVKRWRITRIGEDPEIYTIECSVNGEQRWLHGNTNDGLISLISEGRDDGSKWLLKKIHDDPYIYRIQAYSRGPKRWLFGDIYEGRVGLWSDTSYKNGDSDIFNSDTSWEITDRFGNDLEIG
jgi:hypothetical protein